MKYISPIYTEQTECQDCYKCLRNCPARAIKVENGHAMIVSELCIMCGRCVVDCPSHAKRIRNDLPGARELLRHKDCVIASLAPSFAAEFPEYTPTSLCRALKKLGFYGVSETAIGADLVSAQLAMDLKYANEYEGSQKLFLSSACPSAVEYVKKILPDYEKYITDRSSPLLAHSRFLRQTFGDDIGVVFIGPCIAKKREADVWDSIDISLTFNDLREWFEFEKIKPLSKNESEEKSLFIPFRAAKGALYPIDGGMIASLKKYTIDKNIRCMTVTGIDEIRPALQGLYPESLKNPLFIELLVCPGGCINGPGTSRKKSTVEKRLSLIEYAESAKDVIPFSLLKQQKDLCGTIPVIRKKEKEYSEESIKNAMRAVGKYTLEDELNCSCCGYDSCRDFAKAMLDGCAEKNMCLSYMRKLAQKKANRLIKAIPSGVLIADKDMRVVECNYNFAKLMGSDVADMYETKPGLEGADLTRLIDFYRFYIDVLTENGPDIIEREVRRDKKVFHVTVFSIEKEEVAGSVIQDVTDPQIQRGRIVAKAKKVIDKNLSVVQKIAFLLGENAAETESMLNSIIESFSQEEEEDE